MNASADFLNALTWSLVHFLWQGAAIAALAAACMFVFRSPSTRYLLGLGALALMLASFAVTFSVLQDSPGNGAELSPQHLPAHVAANTWMPDNSAPLSSAPAVAAEQDFLWVARVWLAGVAGLALRIVFGLLVLEYLRRRNLVALPAPLVQKFTALQRRLGIRRFIRYCECQRVRVPAVIGFFRPIVLIPVRALTGLSTEQLEAVVAHELGHIKRFDVAVNFVQVIAETLFFFHPAVWWLNKRIRADREDCCDDVAVAMSGGSLGYAKALAAMATWRDAPRFAMAATGSPLAARVSRLLGARDGGDGRTVGVFAASLVLVCALVTGAVSLGFANPAQAAPADHGFAQIAQTPTTAPQPQIAETASAPLVDPEPRAAPRPTAAPDPVAAPAPRPAPQPAAHASPASPASPANPPSPVGPPAPASPANPPVKVRPPRDAAPAESAGSYIDAMKSAGYEDLDVDDLIAMRLHGVTPEFVRAMRNAGYEPDADELVGMAVHGVTPAFIEQMRDVGLKPGTDEIIAMKTHGISPEFVKGMKDLGISADSDEIVAFKVHGITPEFIRQVRAAGLKPDTDELIALKVHDITPDYQKALQTAGYEMTVEELIQAKVMDITPEFIEQARKHGFKNLDIQKLIQLRHADVL